MGSKEREEAFRVQDQIRADAAARRKEEDYFRRERDDSDRRQKRERDENKRNEEFAELQYRIAKDNWKNPFWPGPNPIEHRSTVFSPADSGPAVTFLAAVKGTATFGCLASLAYAYLILNLNSLGLLALWALK